MQEDRACEDLLKETYFGCDNGGVGGEIDDGCLRYSFTGGLGDEAAPQPEAQVPEDNGGDDASDEQDEPDEDSGDETTDEPAGDDGEQEEPETTITPLEIRGTGCWDEKDHKHTDVHKGTVKEGATLACISAGSTKTPQDQNSIDSLGNVIFEIGWIDGCETETNSQSVGDPLGDGSQTCEDIFLTAWESCNNGGVGGYIEAGCLTYWVTGSVEGF